MDKLVTGFIGFAGVVLGWILNVLTTVVRERPKLCFQMVATPDSELTEKECRIKTSPSGQGIEIFNMGVKPFVLEKFEVSHKKKLLVDCYLPETDRIILPYHNVVYTLTEQESDAIDWHCKDEHFEICQITAYGIDGKRVKGKLPVPLYAMRASIRAVDSRLID